MNDKPTAESMRKLAAMKRRIRAQRIPGYSKADQKHFVEAVSIAELLLEKGRTAEAEKIIDVISRVY